MTAPPESTFIYYLRVNTYRNGAHMRVRKYVNRQTAALGIAALGAAVALVYGPPQPTQHDALPVQGNRYELTPIPPWDTSGRQNLAILKYRVEGGRFVLDCADYVLGFPPDRVRNQGLTAEVIGDRGILRSYTIDDPRGVGYDAPVVLTEFTLVLPVHGVKENIVGIYGKGQQLAYNWLSDIAPCP